MMVNLRMRTAVESVSYTEVPALPGHVEDKDAGCISLTSNIKFKLLDIMYNIGHQYNLPVF
jgi:hypothetical protein